MWTKAKNSYQIWYMPQLLLKDDKTRPGHNEGIVQSEKNKTESFVGFLLILFKRNRLPSLTPRDNRFMIRDLNKVL